MIKELTIAVILGALVGFGATTGLTNMKNKNLDAATGEISTNQTDSGSSDISQDESVPTPTTDHNLTITSPSTDTVIDKSDVTIKGQTSPNSTLIIHTGMDTFFPEIDDTGLFSQEIELEAGANLIQISSLSTNEEQIDKEILITFTTAQF